MRRVFRLLIDFISVGGCFAGLARNFLLRKHIEARDLGFVALNCFFIELGQSRCPVYELVLKHRGVRMLRYIRRIASHLHLLRLPRNQLPRHTHDLRSVFQI